jgi:hypothetical protein
MLTRRRKCEIIPDAIPALEAKGKSPTIRDSE